MKSRPISATAMSPTDKVVNTSVAHTPVLKSGKLEIATAILDNMVTPKESHLKNAITYGELNQLLVSLGFIDKSNKNFFWFKYPVFKKTIKWVNQPADTWLSEDLIEKLNKQLVKKGILENEGDLLKRVKGVRLDAKLDKALLKAQMPM